MEVGPAGGEEQDDDSIVRASGLFDERFYLDQNADVRDAGLDPVLHYVTSGHIEGRDPSADFQTTYYRAKYLKGSLAVNPLVHYITVGRQARYHIATLRGRFAKTWRRERVRSRSSVARGAM